MSILPLNFTLEAARRGHYMAECLGSVLETLFFFFLLPLEQGHQHLRYHGRKHPFHIAMRCIMSEENTERSNKDSLKVKQKKKQTPKKSHFWCSNTHMPTVLEMYTIYKHE